MQRTSRDIRNTNRCQVLRAAVAEGPVSRPRLAVRTGLSLATVSTLVGELLAVGALRDAGREESSGGRPRALVAPRHDGGTLIGVDIAETYLRAEAYDLSLARTAWSEERTPAGRLPDARGPERVAERIAALVRAVTDEASASAGVLGVGVSMPGTVDREGGALVHAANWGWRDVPLLRLLEPRLPHPLLLDNPLRACALAERWFGAARDRADAVVVNLGTGAGAGLTVGGEPHRGRGNAAGEWGHMPLVLGGRACNCGARGCVEAYVGAPGIVRTLRETVPDSPLLSPGDQTTTVGALGRAVAHGDPVAAEVLRRTAYFLGSGIAGLINLLGPDVVVLSGWVATALGEPLLTGVREVVGRTALAGPARTTEIVRCSLTVSPVCLGAAALALERHVTRAARLLPVAPGAPALPRPRGVTGPPASP